MILRTKLSVAILALYLAIGTSASAESMPQPMPRMAITPVAIGSEPAPEETQTFIVAIESLRNWREPAELQVALNFLQMNPENPWVSSMRANLGMIYQRSGRFSLAIEEWETAWQSTKDAPQGTREYHFANSVAAKLVGLFSRLGRVAEVSALLNTFDSRPLQGVASREFESARAALASMVLRPEGAFKCGPYALQTILRHTEAQTAAQAELIAQADSTPQGFSLHEVQLLAEELGMETQMAFRSPGAALPLPAVAHWRSDHFAAVVADDDLGWVVDDPTFQRRIHFTPCALNDESSGYFLIPDGHLPEGWRVVEQAEAATIFGRGAPDDTSEEDDECDEKGGDCQGEAKGMPVYSFSNFHAALIIRDIPIVHHAPVGPSIPFALTYNHRSSENESHALGGLLSPKWTHNWRVYLEEETSGSTSSWRFQTGSNRTERYETDGAESSRHHISQAKLVPTAGAPVRELSDGSSQIFGHSVEIIGGPNLYFLTEFIDPQGNSVTLDYDGINRLTSIKDALGREVILEYDDTIVANDPDSIFRIRSVVLEDERQADCADQENTKSTT